MLLKGRSTVQINMIRNNHFWEIYKFSTYQFRSGANNCILWTLPSPGSHRFTIQTCPQVKHFFQPKNLTTWNARHIELVYTMRRLDPNYSFDDVMSGWVRMPEYTFFLYSFCKQINYVSLQKLNNFRNFLKKYRLTRKNLIISVGKYSQTSEPKWIASPLSRTGSVYSGWNALHFSCIWYPFISDYEQELTREVILGEHLPWILSLHNIRGEVPRWCCWFHCAFVEDGKTITRCCEIQ